MKFENKSASKSIFTLAAIALSVNMALSSISRAEDDMMGSMPNQQQNSMQNNAADTTDSTDTDHDHDQMKKDHAQMKKDHKKMMQHGSSADGGKDSTKKNE